ncbi:MAG: T9SS type A sorting domain-containing protein [Chitinispirillaceae bacterium]|nr:T9SS type A sorting domain-containing protein [Chitinispirillaceae bacterium]
MGFNLLFSFCSELLVTVLALSICGNNVYVGGLFTTIDSQTRNNVACLDVETGSATYWNPNATGRITTQINTIYAIENTIYTGGWFAYIGGQARNSIACIDGATGLATGWNPDAKNSIHALTVNDNSVYVGGHFLSVGNTPCSYFAQFDFIDDNPVKPRPKTIKYSNSFSLSPATRTLFYSLSRSSRVSVSVFTMQGRQIASLVNQWQTQGTYSVSFKSQPFAPGSYIIVLKTGDGTAMQRCALVR